MLSRHHPKQCNVSYEKSTTMNPTVRDQYLFMSHSCSPHPLYNSKSDHTKCDLRYMKNRTLLLDLDVASGQLNRIRKSLLQLIVSISYKVQNGLACPINKRDYQLLPLRGTISHTGPFLNLRTVMVENLKAASPADIPKADSPITASGKKHPFTGCRPLQCPHSICQNHFL